MASIVPHVYVATEKSVCHMSKYEGINLYIMSVKCSISHANKAMTEKTLGLIPLVAAVTTAAAAVVVAVDAKITPAVTEIIETVYSFVFMQL